MIASCVASVEGAPLIAGSSVSFDAAAVGRPVEGAVNAFRGAARFGPAGAVDSVPTIGAASGSFAVAVTAAAPGGVNVFFNVGRFGPAGATGSAPSAGAASGSFAVATTFDRGGVNVFLNAPRFGPAGATGSAPTAGAASGSFAVAATGAGTGAVNGREGLFTSTASTFGSGIGFGAATSGAGDHTNCGGRPSSLAPATIRCSNFRVARNGFANARAGVAGATSGKRSCR
jgi:hypothetical protein